MVPIPSHFDLLPGIELIPDSKSLPNLLGQHWPKRFADAWCELYAPSKPLAHFKQRELRDLNQLLHHWPVHFSGTEGYPKAGVTLGGVDTSGLSSETMEARQVPGLFFIGESRRCHRPSR